MSSSISAIASAARGGAPRGAQAVAKPSRLLGAEGGVAVAEPQAQQLVAAVAVFKLAPGSGDWLLVGVEAALRQLPLTGKIGPLEGQQAVVEAAHDDHDTGSEVRTRHGARLPGAE